MRRLGYGACVLGGVAAGLVAAVLAVVASRALGGTPPAQIAGGSAFVAGLLGGALVLPLAQRSARPPAWVWGVCLFFATAVSVVVARLPRTFLPLPHGLMFLNGLVEPLGQVLQAAGILHRHAPPFAGGPPPGGHLPAGVRHPGGRPGGRPAGGPGNFLVAAITMHYLVAIATAAVAPWVAGLLARPSPRSGAPARPA